MGTSHPLASLGPQDWGWIGPIMRSKYVAERWERMRSRIIHTLRKEMKLKKQRGGEEKADVDSPLATQGHREVQVHAAAKGHA